jgi:hypothetical protein
MARRRTLRACVRTGAAPCSGCRGAIECMMTNMSAVSPLQPFVPLLHALNRDEPLPGSPLCRPAGGCTGRLCRAWTALTAFSVTNLTRENHGTGVRSRRGPCHVPACAGDLGRPGLLASDGPRSRDRIGIGGSGPGKSGWPNRVAADASGDVWVSDGNPTGSRCSQRRPDHRGVRYPPRTRPGQLRDPLGVEFDGAGRADVMDSDSDRVQRFAPALPVPGARSPPAAMDKRPRRRSER